jgi:hypothetical protein
LIRHRQVFLRDLPDMAGKVDARAGSFPAREPTGVGLHNAVGAARASEDDEIGPIEPVLTNGMAGERARMRSGQTDTQGDTDSSGIPPKNRTESENAVSRLLAEGLQVRGPGWVRRPAPQP